MSRVGRSIIKLPKGVSVEISKGNLVTVKGPKGVLNQEVDKDMEITIENGEVKVSRPTEQKRHKSMHGLYNALIRNMVKGVSEGFVKEMELIGVGYRVSNTGNLLEMSMGYSHPIMFYVPDEIKVEATMEKGKNPAIRMESADNQLLGQVAAKLRSYRRPEPYKGKGLRFMNEDVRRKAGKTASK